MSGAESLPEPVRRNYKKTFRPLFALPAFPAMPPAARPVTVTPGSSLSTSGAQTTGMTRANGIVNLSDKICASKMLAAPHTASAVHHHGSQDTVVYAVRGTGAVISEGGKKRQVLNPGDFALIPAGAEHQEVNDGDEEVEWVIVRSGKEPVVTNLDGWS